MRSARRGKTHPSTRTAFESLEPRAMLAGLGPDSFSALGSGNAVLLPGVSGTNLSGDGPAPNASGNSASIISSSVSSGTQPTGLALSSNFGSGAGSSPTASGSAPIGTVFLGGSGPTSTVSGGLFNYLPSGYETGPNSASDPVFQQGYAQWMAASMLATTTTSTSASANGAPTTSSSGVLGSLNNWFSYEYNTWVAMAQNPGATLGGAWDGAVDGAAMAVNAATFHQIDSLNDYVNLAISQNGGVY